MRILLVAPSHLDENNHPVRYKTGYLPPLALAHLAALTPEEHEVYLVDAAVDDIPYDEEWDVVGITSMTGQSGHAYQICDEFHERCWHTKVILGGIHPTILPEEAAQHADIVVIGEAETVWEQILADCDFGEGFFQEYYHGEPWDLQNLVIPEWKSLDFTKYFKAPVFQKPQLPVFTTRGCPFGCDFCTVTSLFGKSYRQKPIANILQEMKATSAEFYFFVDDNIVCNPAYSRELFQAIKNKHPDILWFSQASTTILNTPDLIDLAAESGCTSLFLGIESISSNALNSVNKSFNEVEKYTELFERMYRAGVIPYVSLVFGFDETDPDIFETTFEFLQQADILLSAWWILTPLPGTKLYDQMEKEGRISDHRWSNYDPTQKVIFTPKNFTPESLKQTYWKMYKRFCEEAYQRKQKICDKYKLSQRAVETIKISMSYLRFQVLRGLHPFAVGSDLQL